MGTSLVTISMPYYRTERYIRRAVESLLAQTETRWRLVIVNDGGDPACVWKPIEDLTDPRIVRFNLPENRGLFFAAQVVLGACETPFFLPHDSDDCSEPNRLADLLAAADDADFIASSYIVHPSDGSDPIHAFAEIPTFNAESVPWATTWCNLWRTDFLRAIGGFDPTSRTAFDAILSGLAAWLGRMREVPTAAPYHYNRRADSNSTLLKANGRIPPEEGRNLARWRRILAGDIRDTAMIEAVMTEDRDEKIVEEAAAMSRRLSAEIGGSMSLSFPKKDAQKLRFIYFAPRYPPFFAGGEMAAHGLNAALVRRGHEVDVVTTTPGPNGVKDRWLDGVRVWHGRHDFEYSSLVEVLKPDVLLVQFEPTAVIIKLANEKNIPVATYLHSIYTYPYTGRLDLTICNTHTMAVREAFHGQTVVVYPVIDFKRARSDKPPDRRAITAVNLAEVKGGRLFWHIAKQFPDLPFIGVRGAYGDQVDGAAPNVTVIPMTDNIAEVYRQTRVLLVLSPREESFGMVGIEAQSLGIPIVAADKSTLREAFGEGALFFPNGDADAAAAAVRKLTADSALYARLSAAAVDNAGRYSNSDREVADLVTRLRAIIKARAEGPEVAASPVPEKVSFIRFATRPR